MKHFLDIWLDGTQPLPKRPSVWIYRERKGARALVSDAVCEAVKDHLVGVELLKRLGFPKAAELIKSRLPTMKKVRSGDLGEILATEYIDHKTPFRVVLKRLRYKDDRDTSMRGDDVIGVRKNGKQAVALKAEVKSRASLGASVVAEAATSLLRHGGRPNPASLGFISHQLRLMDKDADAELVEALQERELRPRDITHLLFTFSGNHPLTAFLGAIQSPIPELERHLVGFVVTDHQAFIAEIFGRIDGAKP